MAMEARLYGKRRDAVPAWMPGFGALAERALMAMAGALRNPVGNKRRYKPAEVETRATSPDSTLLEIECDRIRTSLRSLGEEIAKRGWL